MTYRHYPPLSFFYTFDDQYSTVLDSPYSGAVNVYEVATASELPPLLEFCLSDISVESDILIFHVSDTKSPAYVSQ